MEIEMLTVSGELGHSNDATPANVCKRYTHSQVGAESREQTPGTFQTSETWRTKPCGIIEGGERTEHVHSGEGPPLQQWHGK